MSALLADIYQALQIKRIRTAPYHPQTDGLVERFNGTLKSMLKKFASQNQRDWNEYLPYLLFAYREVPTESTGFSPFELLYGHRVRGPLDVLRETWTEEESQEMPVAAHVVDMRSRLHEMAELVQENMTKSQRKQKCYYDRGTQERTLKVGEQVLVLLPTVRNKLKLEWVGPYRVTRQVTPVDYELEMPGRRKERKVYHINLLKRWNPAPAITLLATCTLEEPEEEEEVSDLFPWEAIEDPELPELGEIQSPDLSEEKQEQLLAVAEEFSPVFRKTPGRTSLTQHVIHVSDEKPVHQKPYRVPYSKREAVKQEIRGMLEAKIIRPSTSAWASPVVLVDKKGGGTRFCVDYRQLNQHAAFDAYPMPRMTLPCTVHPGVSTSVICGRSSQG